MYLPTLCVTTNFHEHRLDSHKVFGYRLKYITRWLKLSPPTGSRRLSLCYGTFVVSSKQRSGMVYIVVST